ncbi:MAG: Na+/H+ antiporter NhaC [Bacteroidetes bacterium RBG_13_42_15]|nr:MAG: Na+/H+ antiporter NhaC [Bacteroidetes bacterium RBG_13_42_15]
MSIKDKPSLFQSLIPIIFLIAFLSLNVIIFKGDTLSGSNQIILLLSASIAGLIALRFKVSWTKILHSITNSINTAMPSILILLIIGSLAGTWLVSGIVPVMIYYGLKMIHPSVFLFTALVVCCLVSLITGSSWSTVATIGVALLGIGKTLGLHEGLVAGAIISGSYFGDKMSPLSDTTNLAPAVAGTDLFTHIRYMVITTTPSIILAAIIFSVIGFSSDYGTIENNVNAVIESIEKSFHLSPFLLLIPVMLIIVIVKKVPALPALLIGTLLGAIAALIFQPHILNQLGREGLDQFRSTYQVILQSMFGDISIQTDNESMNELFSTGGMAGMLNTVWLIISAMVFGGAMESAGLLTRISHSVVNLAHSTGSLIASTVATCIFFNLTASDQYISIVVPGRMYAKTFRERGLKPEVLSRTLEDAGTLTSVLVPWNTCGATQAKVLGVATITYLPYCFFNLINPVVAIIIAYMNYKIRRIGDEK